MGLSLPLVSLWTLSRFSPFRGQPGHTVRLVPPLPLLRTIFFSAASLVFLPSSISLPFLKVFAQSGFAQRGNTFYDPKRSLAAMSRAYLRWHTHALQPLSYTPPMLMVPPTLLAACGYLTPLSLGIILYITYRARYLNASCLNSPPFSSWSIVHWSNPPKKMASLGILSGSSSGAHSLPLLYFRTPPHGLSSFSLLQFPILSFFISLGLYVLACPQGHLLSYFDSYTLSFYLNSLVEIFMVHSPYHPFYPPSFLITTNIHDHKFASLSQPIQLTPIGIFFRCYPQR